jgi:UDP-N-acetylmuramyl-tripeptide synthetase
LQQLASYPQVSVQALIDHLREENNLAAAPNVPELLVSAVAYDSRTVTTGSAFFCLPGEKTDGNRFIEDALKLGASVVFSDKPAPPSLTLESGVFVQVRDVRAALAQSASFLYNFPSSKLRLLGVTGTNGKTTTTHLVEHVLRSDGRKVGLIGTLGARTNLGDQQTYLDIKHTTPQASDLQKLLFQMHCQGVSHVAMEVSSHALALKRVAECQFASTCLTNLTQDHLDFHKTMEDYFLAKLMLFRQIGESSQSQRTAIINNDDPYSARFCEAIDKAVKVQTYGWDKSADLFVENADFEFSGTQLTLNGVLGRFDLPLHLNGRFNVYNMMAALLLCFNEGVSLSRCCEALSAFTGVAGRFERVIVSTQSKQAQPLCLVDYAHTPDGLENVLKSARALVPQSGKLIVVFGCGGDRDPLKRPKMGRIAEELADELFITSDNPRSEEPEAIINAILTGIEGRKDVHVEPDRTTAIEAAINIAAGNDVIVIAGKGHETYQILKDRTIDFDDRLVAKAALEERLGG